MWDKGNLFDSLSDYFSHIFESANLVDVLPSTLVPTWPDERCGNEGVAKHLNRFHMMEDLSDNIGGYRIWDHSMGFSGHKSI